MEKLKFRPMDPSAVSCDPASMARMRAAAFNESTGSLRGFDCPQCRNRGGFYIPREDGSLQYRECKCMVTRRCLAHMEASGLKNVIREKTFGTFTAEQPWQKTMKDAAKAYAESPTGWLLLSGQSGCGKTHLATAVCRERLLQGDEVRYLGWREEISLLKACPDPEEREKKKNVFKKAAFLYIDDLFKAGAGPDGQCRITAADISLAFEILNYRYINHLSTVISTELSGDALLSLDEALGGRILEMAAGRTFLIGKDLRKNYRLREAAAGGAGT